MSMLFMTTFKAIDRRDGEIKLWRGPNIQAIGYSDAQFIVNSKQWHYLKVEGVIMHEDEDNSEMLKWYN
jgi:hypothetical protein